LTGAAPGYSRPARRCGRTDQISISLSNPVCIVTGVHRGERTPHWRGPVPDRGGRPNASASFASLAYKSRSNSNLRRSTSARTSSIHSLSIDGFRLWTASFIRLDRDNAVGGPRVGFVDAPALIIISSRSAVFFALVSGFLWSWDWQPGRGPLSSARRAAASSAKLASDPTGRRLSQLSPFGTGCPRSSVVTGVSATVLALVSRPASACLPDALNVRMRTSRITICSMRMRSGPVGSRARHCINCSASCLANARPSSPSSRVLHRARAIGPPFELVSQPEPYPAPDPGDGAGPSGAPPTETVQLALAVEKVFSTTS
jgi:hypothetical protein